MNNFKRASISVVVVLGIGILIMSLNRQPDAIGVGASAPVVSSDVNVTTNNVDLTQTNTRLSDVEDNISQITETQQKMLGALQELVKASKHSNQAASTVNNPNDDIQNEVLTTAAPPTTQEIAEQTRKDNEFFAAKENYFYTEAVDDAWRSNEESKLNSIFEEQQINASNLECRGSSCRLELAAIDLDAANDELDKLVLSMPNAEGEFKQEKQDDGSFKTILIIKPASN